MSDPISAVKLVAGTLAAGAAVPALADAANKAEQLAPIVGVSWSVLLVAVAGALIGVVLLPERDTDRVKPAAHLKRAPRALQLGVRLVAIFGVVLAYAVVAAWSVALASSWFPFLQGSPELPLAGISGVVIRRMLPGYLKVLERVTGGIGGGAKE
ncbi:hypothetical protein A7A76_07740 [Lysobacter enzymogenes]|uniref:hypothetical protein n=1 Tax=Lysobacter enzymogenes TaxID=69 RepID=UPI001F14CB64|nr:hypothetical protein [Lysobacter enzymogenes]MBN7138985.1 hypothetical protein [Lysobacter enzymogenes]